MIRFTPSRVRIVLRFSDLLADSPNASIGNRRNLPQVFLRQPELSGSHQGEGHIPIGDRALYKLRTGKEVKSGAPELPCLPLYQIPQS
jgi:hypothetical protein